MFFYGYRTWRSQADTDQEASPSWLAFTALERQSWIEGAMQAAEEGKPLTVLPSCESCELTTVVTLRPSVQSWRRHHGRGHRFPFGFKAHSTAKLAKNPLLGGHRSLLNGRNIKLSSEFLPLSLRSKKASPDAKKMLALCFFPASRSMS